MIDKEALYKDIRGPDTLFIVRVSGFLYPQRCMCRQKNCSEGKNSSTMIGVYTSFEEASSIMLEYVETILACEGLRYRQDYVVRIEEKAIWKNDTWLPIRIRAEDKSRQEEYDKSISQ